MKKVIVKGVVLGEGAPKICVPIAGRDEKAVLADVYAAVGSGADIIEWRADYLSDISDDNIINILNKINEAVPHFPLIFTLRIKSEGGNKFIAQNDRRRIIKKVIKTGLVEIVDVELINGDDFIRDIYNIADDFGVYLIVSYHNFDGTPDKAEVCGIINRIYNSGCSIVKVAFMALQFSDVLAVVNAASEFANGNSVPIIAISMGEMGIISRVGAGNFGSALTFAALRNTTAPGQVCVGELREIMNYF